MCIDANGGKCVCICICTNVHNVSRWVVRWRVLRVQSTHKIVCTEHGNIVIELDFSIMHNMTATHKIVSKSTIRVFSQRDTCIDTLHICIYGGENVATESKTEQPCID